MSATPTPSPDALPIPEGVKHTPGPWHIHPKGIGQKGSWIKDGPNSCDFLAVSYLQDSPEREAANARLIAASPDLLEALRSVLPFLRTAEALWEDAPYPDVLASKLARAEAAIRLAQTGER